MTAQSSPIVRSEVSLSVDVALVEDAAALSIDLPRLLEETLRSKVAAEKARRWAEENAEAIEFSNEEVRRNGLWSDGLRTF